MCKKLSLNIESINRKTKQMKTIQVTDEVYNGLMQIATEMNKQDHRATAMPYFFQVATTHKVACNEGNGIEALHFDGTLIETKEEKIETIIDSGQYPGYTKKDLIGFSEGVLDGFLIDLGFTKVYYEIQQRLENAFFTEKACKHYIATNSHNLRNPQDFLTHAHRNPEFELVSKFLVELAGGKLHK